MKRGFDMSKKSKKTKKSPTNNKQSQRALLGDHTAEKKEILFYIAILSICAIIMFVWVIPATFNEPEETPTDNVVTSELEINITAAEILNGEQWNVWFDIKSVSEKGEFTFNPESGWVFAYDNATDTILEDVLTSIDLSKINEYTFVWVYPVATEEINYNRLDITFENAVTKVDNGIFMSYDNDTYQFHSKAFYEGLVATKEGN